MEIDLEKAKISKMLIKTKLLKFDLDLKKREMVDSEKAKKISPAKNLLKKSLTIQTVLGLIAISAGGLGFLKALDEYEAYKEFRENENRITFKDDLIKLAEGLEKDSTGLTITFLTYFGKDAIPILLHELEIKRNRDEVFAAIKAILHSSESQRENTIKIILINATRFFDKEARKKTNAVNLLSMCHYIKLLNEIGVAKLEIDLLTTKITTKHQSMHQHLASCNL